MSAAPELTQALLISLLHYDPETGVFTWRARDAATRGWNARYAGKVAGFDWSPNGKTFYRSIRIFDWPFLGHRLAVLYMTGSWPERDVDHRDLDGLNNRWTNLRPASKSQNGANRGASAVSRSGMKGVTFDARACRWRATIGVMGQQKWLGSFSTPEEAQTAYADAATKYFGEFARTA